MAGNRIGGLKAAQRNKEKYGADWYKRIGAIGGKKPTLTPKGFAADPGLAATAGRKGGKARLGRKYPRK